ncbi:hypothetical protein AR687_24400 [Flavobacteriaceae bacterium CRH]|nr:hypothetical protein AR687_24400 [Flavobacteriaceae bacterium CRH]
MLKNRTGMKKNKYLILFTFFTINLLIGQNHPKANVKIFSPKNNSYNIYYPENYITEEDTEGIVSIFNKSKDGNEKEENNITISNYIVDKNFSTDETIALMKNYFKDYFSIKLEDKDFKSFKSKYDNLLECDIKENDNYWKWWTITLKNKIFIISLNKKTDINDENVTLLRHMIDNLTIN